MSELKVYDLRLTTKAPLYIGMGVKLTKKEYIFDPDRGRVCIPNQELFFRELVRRGMEDSYEGFMLYNDQRSLYDLLRENKWKAAEIDSISAYSVMAGDELLNGRRLTDLDMFCRNGIGEAYIPGSALKGQIRTVLMIAWILDHDLHEDLRGKDAAKRLEARCFHTLNLTERADNAVNSIMRGVRISDSCPIPNNRFMVCRKEDAFPSGMTKTLPIARECVIPETTVAFKLTLDSRYTGDLITAETIRHAITRYNEWYTDACIYYFDAPDNEAKIATADLLYFGGGAGYFTKTVTYAAMEHDDAVNAVSQILSGIRAFQKHKHEYDPKDFDISPHTLKYTKYRDKLYPMGACKVEIL